MLIPRSAGIGFEFLSMLYISFGIRASRSTFTEMWNNSSLFSGTVRLYIEFLLVLVCVDDCRIYCIVLKL